MDTNMRLNIDKRDNCIQHYIYFSGGSGGMGDTPPDKMWIHFSFRFSFLFSFFVPIIGTVQSSSILKSQCPCVRACVRAKFDAWKRARAGTKLRRGAKKTTAGDGSTRANKNGGKKLFWREGRRGREKKILFGRERKKNIIRAGAKKNSGVNENTTHKKAYVQ